MVIDFTSDENLHKLLKSGSRVVRCVWHVSDILEVGRPTFLSRTERVYFVRASLHQSKMTYVLKLATSISDADDQGHVGGVCYPDECKWHEILLLKRCQTDAFRWPCPVSAHSRLAFVLYRFLKKNYESVE